MGRPKRVADGGVIYHVLNRANARMTIFEKDEDYEAFERVLQEAVERTETHDCWRAVSCPTIDIKQAELPDQFLADYVRVCDLVDEN